MVRSLLFTLALVAAAPLSAQAAGAAESVSRAKIAADAEAEFGRIDTNKDGQMSRVEIEAFQRVALAARATARNKAMFAELDSDKNGQISAAEFARATPVPKPDASGVLSIDTNKDGQISRAENSSARMASFDRFDSNKDGQLTAAEVEAATRK